MTYEMPEAVMEGVARSAVGAERVKKFIVATICGFGLVAGAVWLLNNYGI